jgi:hypothetical protein
MPETVKSSRDVPSRHIHSWDKEAALGDLEKVERIDDENFQHTPENRKISHQLQ